MSSSIFGVLFVFIAELGEPDKQYATTPNSAAVHVTTHESHGPGAASVLTTAIGRLPSLTGLFGKATLPGSAKPGTRREGPETVIWIRVSKNYLNKHVEREVSRKKPLRDCILGTTIVGESITTGKTRLVLHPNDRHALGEVQFVGEVHAKTIGRNGPAILHYLSDSTFQASKRLAIGEVGLSASPAVAAAPTRLTLTHIGTNLPGLRGRLVEQIARGRVADTRSLADAIASDHTANTVRDDLDRKLNESVTALQEQLRIYLGELQVNSEKKPMRLQSRSMADYVEVAMVSPSAPPNEMRLAPITIEGNPDIAIRVHHTVLAQAFTHAHLREAITPLLGNVIQTRQTRTKNSSQNAQSQLAGMNWSMDGEWLAVSYTALAPDETHQLALEAGHRNSDSIALDGVPGDVIPRIDAPLKD